MITVSDEWTDDEAATGLLQEVAFSTTATSKYFSLKFVPDVKGRSRRAKISVLPPAITPCGGYLNSNPYVMLVKVSQSLANAVGVGVVTCGGDGVDVGERPRMERLVPTDGIFVRMLVPWDTRASHSMLEIPSAMPLTLNVNTTPLVVALLPWLPAMARMKLPFCGPLIAEAGSWPNKPAATILLASRSVGL